MTTSPPGKPTSEAKASRHAADSLTSAASSGELKHVAIIMDGNNRWTKKRLLPRFSGHKAGVEAIRKVLSACEKHQIEVLTLFAFSSENWQRSADEVSSLMRLLLHYLKREVASLHRKNVRVRFIGSRERLNSEIVRQMEKAEVLTKDNSGSTLVLAVDYGGHWDITQATRNIVQQVQEGKLDPSSITEGLVGQHMALSDLPPPDLCIRSGGEYRISNFLLWQLSYAELYFTNCYWPDFGEVEIDKAVTAFAARQRRYGKNSDQLTAADQVGHA